MDPITSLNLADWASALEASATGEWMRGSNWGYPLVNLLHLLGLLLLPSGALLFTADAGPLLGNPLLQFKLLLVALGIANALAFRWLWAARLDDWDWRPPWAGQIQAALSALCWLATGTLGRLIAYG